MIFERIERRFIMFKTLCLMITHKEPVSIYSVMNPELVRLYLQSNLFRPVTKWQKEHLVQSILYS